MKAFQAYEVHMERRRLEDPLAIIREFVTECIRARRPRPGETWTFQEVWEKEPYQNCRHVGRMTYLFMEVVELLSRGQVAEAHATAILGWRAGKQYSLNGGVWAGAWELTGMQDPFRQQQWGGTPEQLAVIASYLEAESALARRVRQGSFQRPTSERVTDEYPNEEDGPSQGQNWQRRPKGKAKPKPKPKA